MDLVDRAFQIIDRRDFVPRSLVGQAKFNKPLPIGFNQTISQPSTVRSMLLWLDAKPNNKILDVGSGSGWTSALLSQIVGPNGKIFAVERIPELLKLGKNNCQSIGITNVSFFIAGKKYGLPKYAPYNRILVNASAQSIPPELIDQLEVGGKMVIPVKNDIIEITKTDDNKFDSLAHPGYIFVPLISESYQSTT